MSAEAPQDLGPLVERARVLEKALSDGPLDHGIALAFLERASGVLEDPDAEPADLAAASVILHDVLPAYAAFIELELP